MSTPKPPVLKPGCPACGSKLAMPHCMPSSLSNDRFRTADHKEPQMRKRVKPACPWLRCSYQGCGHLYDAQGRSFDPKSMVG